MGVITARDVGLHGRGMELVIVSIVFTSVALALVLARVSTRLKMSGKLGGDDFCICASVFFSIGLGISNCVGVDYGYGKKGSTLSTPDHHAALKSFWAIQILYKFTINLTKSSILLLYLRIFPNKFFRKAVYALLVFVLGYATASITGTIFECTPIRRSFDHRVHGTCINLTAFWYANAVASIFGDFTTLVLPIKPVFALQLPPRQKCGLFMVFGLGSFVCATSILRMTTLDPASKNPDQTYGTFISTIWTTVEANTGIICACLPTLKAPLTYIFPMLFPRSSQDRTSKRASIPRPHTTSGLDFEGLGRFDGRKQSHARSTMIASPTHTHNASDEEIFGMETITKTTDISVEFNDHSRSGSSSAGDKDSVTIPHSVALPYSQLTVPDFKN